MSADTKIAEAINFPEAPATVLLRTSDLAVILDEVKRLRSEVAAVKDRQDQDYELLRRRYF
jgi:hypothetical protein